MKILTLFLVASDIYYIPYFIRENLTDREIFHIYMCPPRLREELVSRRNIALCVGKNRNVEIVSHR